jgi:hypothetical protein
MLWPLVLLVGAAFGTPGPWSDSPLDPAARLIDRQGRAEGADLLYGARCPSSLSLGRRARQLGELSPVLQTVLGPELRGGSVPRWWARHRLLGAAGDAQPQLQGGDIEPGLVSLRGSSELTGRWGPAALLLRPEVAADLQTETGNQAELTLPEAWVGVHTPRWQVGFGRMDRWLGPGRHGGLMLTDNAMAAPLGSVAWQDRISDRWGRLRVEVGAGWLDQPRTDVNRPGWLLADLRWAPMPMIELGASRMGVFGGQGRPAPEITELLLPLDPHVEDDPDQELPDQDEIAALDARLTLPLQVQEEAGHLELYIQYGGEDMIVRDIIGLPVPALAGVANLYGVEVGLGALVLDIEHARVLDDRFRWYTGHRIYHEGFTQAGQVMGHPEGGDARSTQTSARWFPGEWGVELSYGHALQVGVTAVQGSNLQALMADTRTDRIGLRGWALHRGLRWLHGGATLVRTANPDFLPGPPEWSYRVSIGG